MKNPIREAVSLRCRADRAIENLNQARRQFERGELSPTELLDEASNAVSRTGNMELANPSSALEYSVNRKVYEFRRYAQETAALAIGCKDVARARVRALESARLALALRDRHSARRAHEILWATTGGEMNEDEWAAFEACEML